MQAHVMTLKAPGARVLIAIGFRPESAKQRLCQH
jgi:hypothetical protein